LWPERSSESARHSLSDAVYRLRKALGRDCIVSNGDSIHINTEIIRTDLASFDHALRDRDLALAVSLRPRPFMDGFHLPESQAFEDWRAAEARRLDELVEEALEELARVAYGAEDWKSAINYWARLSDMDPYNTRYCMGWVDTLEASGDPGNAIRLGEDHIELLRDDLGAEPPSDLPFRLDALRLGAGGKKDGDVSIGGARGADGGLPFGVRPSAAGAFRHQAFGGRQEELDRLRGFLEGTMEGRGGVALITGEAGTGKTALATEFSRRMEVFYPNLVVATGHGNAHTGSGDPYLLFREVLCLLTGDVEEGYAAGSISLDRAKRLWALFPVSVGALLARGPDLIDTFLDRRRLRGHQLDFFGGATPESNGLRADLAEITTASKRAAQPALLMQFGATLRAISKTHPLLLILDDLQWADSSSVNLLSHLARHLEGTRILILCLFRPSEAAVGLEGARHPLDPVVNELKRTFGDIELHLGETTDRGFVDSIVDLQPNTLQREFRDRLFDLTRGHALLTVELIQAMQDRGALLKDKEGRWVERGDLSWDVLPARVEAVISERLRRLPDRLRRALRVASASGEFFSGEAVEAVIAEGGEDPFPSAVEELERVHHLIHGRGIRRSTRGSQSVYRFRHILFQRYAYKAMGEEERIRTHRFLGLALEEFHRGKDREEHSLEIARHFQEAGLPEKALEYWELAGIRAQALGAYPESAQHLAAALESLLLLPPGRERDLRELDLQIELGFSLMYSAGAGQEETCLRALELSRRVGSSDQLFAVLAQEYWTFCHYGGDHRKGRRVAEAVLSLARTLDDVGLLSHALEVAGCAAHMVGDFPSALVRYHEMAVVYDPEVHGHDRYSISHDPRCSAIANIGSTLWALGFPDQALILGREAVTKARQLENPSTLLMVTMFLGFLHAWRMEFEEARTVLADLRERSWEVGAELYYDPFILTFSGWCQARQGEIVAGIQDLEKGLMGHREIGWSPWLPYRTALLADALRLAGQPEEGLKILESAQEGVESREDLYHESDVLRIKGELLLALSSPDPIGAEAAFREALTVARRQGARSYELRAACSLAEFLIRQDRKAEAETDLWGVHVWFTEGFDTPDLKRAGVLLKELDPVKGARPLLRPDDWA
ncbi:MAG: AAA family ATPase, partial [Gemmatimonadetes bacterium]|nr:AAA family ATPase [Gemmatimonadota bacterium]NNM03924.1 AAA family ATPase [Gemmatimonadota bacterium]